MFGTTAANWRGKGTSSAVDLGRSDLRFTSTKCYRASSNADLTHIRNIRTHFRRLVGKQVNMKTLVSAVLVAVTLLLAQLTHATAQAETFTAGTRAAHVDGMEVGRHSSYQPVPANAADGATDPRE